MRGNDSNKWFGISATAVIIVSVAWWAFVVWAIIQIVHAVQR